MGRRSPQQEPCEPQQRSIKAADPGFYRHSSLSVAYPPCTLGPGACPPGPFSCPTARELDSLPGRYHESRRRNRPHLGTWAGTELLGHSFLFKEQIVNSFL